MEAEVPVQQPLIDRLIDHDPSSRVEAAPTRGQAVARLRAALKRDLEWLLNTRRVAEHRAEPYAEVARSVFNYGLPDLSSSPLNSFEHQMKLLRTVEQTIALFEPRLSRVKVTALRPMSRHERAMHFRIDALLVMDPAPERVLFDAVLDVGRGECQVEG